MGTIQSKKNIVLEKLSKLIKKENKINLLTGIFKLFSILLLFFGFISFFEQYIYFSIKTKLIIFIVFILLFISLFIFRIFKPLIKIFKKETLKEYFTIADKVGLYFPEIKDNLLNTLQLLEDKHNTSFSLTNAAFETVYKKIVNLNFNRIIDYSSLKKSVNIFFAVLSLAFFSLLVFPQIRAASFRLLHFNTQYLKPSDFNLESLTGNLTIKKGNDVTIRVKAFGKIPDKISIATKTKFETEFNEHHVSADTNNIFALNLKNNTNSLVYFAHKKDVVTKSFFIKVLDPPIINFLELKITPPKYSRLPVFNQQDNGNLEVLPGTKIRISLESTKTLSEANFIKNDTIKIPFYVSKNKAEGKIIVRNSFNYHFSLLDIDSNQNNNPITYEVKTIFDVLPSIEITSPEKYSLLPQNNIVNIAGKIKDDYGFTKLLLNYKITESLFSITDSSFKTIPILISKTIREQNFFYNWDFSQLSVREKDVISFYIEVFDNDNINGPKFTRSELYKIRVPSLDELFAQAEHIQNNAVKDLTKTLKESGKLKDKLKAISNKLKQNKKKLNWNEKKQVEKSIEDFKELTKKANEIQQNLEKMKQEMQQNNLLSKETMEKYNELQNLMDKLNNEELQKALEKMQKSLQKLNRNQVQNSLENFKANEEAFRKSIERTLNLLKKIQVEQKVDEAIKRMEKLNKDLNKLSNEIKKRKENTTNKTKNDLVNKQKNIDEQLKNLQKELDKLNEKMKEVNDMPQKEMEKIKESFEEQKNSETSKQAMQELQKNNFQNAMQNLRQLSNNINSAKDQMQNLKKQMQQQNQQMVMQNMMKAINDLISTSKEEETLQQKTEQNKFRPSQLSKLAENQMELSQNINNILKQMNKLSQKTFAITPEMGKALGKASQAMKESISGLQNRNGNQASYKQSEAMKSLNEAAMLMQSSLQQMMQGGGQGNGMMSLMQQLQQLSQQQMSLNQLTQQLKQGRLSMQQLAEMQRLAQQQMQIQKSLDRLNKEAKQSGQSKKIASNLEKIVDEMKEVISGLNTKKLDDGLIKKQNKILSKLLDAQRSINERDFEKNRESGIGKTFNNHSPNEINLTNKKIEESLHEELIKAVKEGYSKDYEELIRKYFEELEKSGHN